MLIQPRCGMHDRALIPDAPAGFIAYSKGDQWYSIDLDYWRCPEAEDVFQCRSSWDFIVEVHATGDESNKWEIRGA